MRQYLIFHSDSETPSTVRLIAVLISSLWTMYFSQTTSGPHFFQIEKPFCTVEQALRSLVTQVWSIECTHDLTRYFRTAEPQARFQVCCKHICILSSIKYNRLALLLSTVSTESSLLRSNHSFNNNTNNKNHLHTTTVYMLLLLLFLFQVELRNQKREDCVILFTALQFIQTPGRFLG